MDRPLTFETRVTGIPCQCRVLATPDEVVDQAFQFEILDRRGYPAPWLERKLDSSDDERLHDEYVEQYGSQ